jgi:hypothetical protein
VSRTLLRFSLAVTGLSLVVAILLVVAWQLGIKTAAHGYVEGTATAVLDLGTGKLGWRSLSGWGYPVGHQVVTNADVLERDFGVRALRTNAGSGCSPPPDETYLRARTDAYNLLMKPAIERRHGGHVFPIVQARSKRETERNRERCGRGDRSACGFPRGI